MILYKTTCSTDWKGRPHHSIKVLGASDDRNWLLQLQNADVAKWQKGDIDDDNENADADEGSVHTPLTTWEIEGERWEMQAENPKELGPQRVFAGKIESDTWSIVYHIHDDSEWDDDKNDSAE